MNSLKAIKQGLNTLINSEIPNTQLEIYSNGRVLIQAFNFSDVQSWSFALPYDEDGIVLNLFFHKGKLNNEKHFKNFESLYSNEFELVLMNKGSVKSYYKHIKKEVGAQKAAEIIYEIVYRVYELEGDQVIDTIVRAF